MIELNCETDFVARTDDFHTLGRRLARHVLAHAEAGIGDGTDLDDQPWAGAGGESVGEVIKATSGKTGEAVVFRRYARFSRPDGAVAHYLHHNGLVGVLVELADTRGDAAASIGRDVALHVASADPIGVRPEDIPSEQLDRERRIAEEQVTAEGKPEQIRSKIVEGKLKKFVAERTLLEQPFVRDDKQTVSQIIAAAGGATIVRFARFQVGAA